MAHLGLGQDDAAAALSDEAGAIWPSYAHIWTTRGLAESSPAEAVKYFRRAAELGDEGYMPYYSLAMDAYDKGDYRTALHWAREALSRSNPDQQGAARLHGFVAGCIDLAGGAKQEADKLFRRAIELDPQDPAIKDAYTLFLADAPARPHAPPPAPRWRERTRELAPPTPRRFKRDVDRVMRRVLEPAGA
jgi:tetratricopeptide (TPR) repeat protein